MRPNQKGFMFTFIVLVLILGLLGLIFLVKENRQGFNATEASVIINLNNKHSNLSTEASRLTEGKQDYMNRMLPFNYYLDYNSLVLEYDLPFKQGDFDTYFDMVNGFEVFLEDENFARGYDGFETDINVLQNSAWGGAADNLRFTLRPHCFYFNLDGVDRVRFDAGGGAHCSLPFTPGLIRRFDVNAGFHLHDDFNQLACSFNGAANCPQDAFNPLNPDPFIEVRFLDSTCPDCQLPQASVSGHFNPALDHNILVNCDGNAACFSQPLAIHFGQHLELSYAGTDRLAVKTRAELTQAIESLEFMDFNMLVSRPDFKAKKR